MVLDDGEVPYQKLYWNPNELNHIGFYYLKPGHVYNVNGHSIERISKEKDLGVKIDQ